MKIVLRKVRNNQYANKLVRIFLRKLHTFLNNAIDHWTPYGTVDVQFNGVCFSSYSEADDYITGNLYYNKPIIESRDLNVFLSFARHCETILDIGANVGLYSILSSKVNTKAAIYAFEPNKVNLARLKKKY